MPSLPQRAEETRGDLRPCPPDCFDQWWRLSTPNDALVNMLVLGIAHHHATGHLCGGGGDSFDCEDCDFAIEDGRVLAGGWVRFRRDDGPTSSDHPPTADAPFRQ